MAKRPDASARRLAVGRPRHTRRCPARLELRGPVSAPRACCASGLELAAAQRVDQVAAVKLTPLLLPLGETSADEMFGAPIHGVAAPRRRSRRRTSATGSRAMA